MRGRAPTRRPSAAPPGLAAAFACLATCLAAGCARFQGLGQEGDVEPPPDGDVDTVGGDGAGGDGASGQSQLILSPPRIEDRWVDSGLGPVTYDVRVRRADGADFAPTSLTSNGPWLTAAFTTSSLRAEHVLRITVVADALAPGPSDTTVVLSDPQVAAIALLVSITVVEYDPVFVGPYASGCPRRADDGSLIVACDASGTDGLAAAAAAATAGTHLIVFPGAYAGPFSLAGGTWLGPPPSVGPDEVFIICSEASPQVASTITLAGDGIRIHGLTVLVGVNCGSVFSAQPPGGVPAASSRGHLIEDVVGVALAPPVVNYNGIQAAFYLGPNSTVRNSSFWGYFDGISLSAAAGSRVVHDTFVLWDNAAPHDVAGVTGLSILDNVFLRLNAAGGPLFLGSAGTAGLTIAGNVAEGHPRWIEGLDAGDLSNSVQSDGLGPIDLTAPLAPTFRADGVVTATAGAAGEGLSLDGAWLDDDPDALPGAFQARSAAIGPRASVLRIGPLSACGAYPCDLTAIEEDEVQSAVWLAWPGTTVEIYPAQTPYAGNAVISWPVSLRGMGAPGEVVLAPLHEGNLLRDMLHWRHGAILTSLRHVNGILLQGLTLDVEAGAGVWIEDGLVGNTASLERLVIRGAGEVGAVLGDATTLHDSLVVGAFEVCVRSGPRAAAYLATPPAQVFLFNVSCRLTGSPRAFFEVAATDGSYFVNLAAEAAELVPLFAAQRRSLGDGGTYGIDAPLGMYVDRLTVRGVSVTASAFDPTPLVFEWGAIDALDGAAPFFTSATDSTLAPGAQAIDSGVDPRGLDATLPLGNSLDGVIRAGRLIDRGAYEQGL